MGDFKKVLVLLLLLTISYSALAQYQYNPWAIKVGFNAVDYYPVGQDVPQGELFDEFFNATDHWNILPLTTKLTVSRYWKNRISFSTTFSFNTIEKFGSNIDPITKLESNNTVDNLSYISFDGAITYSFTDASVSDLEPYLGIGGGYTWLNAIGSGTVNASLGMRYWFSDKLGIELETTYKHEFEAYAFRHFQHSLSLAYKFGGEKDSDRDGIIDSNDACPNEPGPFKYNGCPDTDGDGVEDIKDKCPKTPGLETLEGCPDQDNDGVADKNDYCPDVAGLKNLGGCPDKDADGIIDSRDKCPDAAGPKENYGCPWPDADADGIPDKFDKCPEVAGLQSKNGCPDLSNEDKELLDFYGQTILFLPGRSELKIESNPGLKEVLAIITNASQSSFVINGHTDNIGPTLSNQLLSEERALKVKNYLIANGVNPNRLQSYGFGETRPIADNSTPAGRRQNRRVVIKLLKQ